MYSTRAASPNYKQYFSHYHKLQLQFAAVSMSSSAIIPQIVRMNFAFVIVFSPIPLQSLQRPLTCEFLQVQVFSWLQKQGAANSSSHRLVWLFERFNPRLVRLKGFILQPSSRSLRFPPFIQQAGRVEFDYPRPAVAQLRRCGLFLEW